MPFAPDHPVVGDGDKYCAPVARLTKTERLRITWIGVVNCVTWRMKMAKQGVPEARLRDLVGMEWRERELSGVLEWKSALLRSVK